jgi:RNA polymerase sigma-70 factor (ECF subfamily)
MTANSLHSGRFHTTRWTHVLAARGNSPEAKQALRVLCETYYAPVELFVRRFRGSDNSRDLTHEFFAKLLEGKSLGNLDRERGRFRSYLLGAVKHFLADLRDRDLAERRGGGHSPQSLDCPPTEADAADRGNVDISDPDGLPPDGFFDRQWAVALVERAIETLRLEAISEGDLERFDVLKQWLVATDTPVAEEQVDALGLSASALKVAVHRLRKRFRQVVKARIADTVGDPAEISDELSYLISALTISMRDSR